MKKPPPMLSPRIIADMRSGDECGDPDHPGLRVRRTNELLKTRRALHDIFVFPSPIGEQHVGQKALGLAQYEARKEM